MIFVPGAKPFVLDLEPVAASAAVLEQEQRPGDRVDRDVDVAVVVVVGGGQAAAVDDAGPGGRPTAGAGVGELAAVPLAGQVLEHLQPLGVLLRVQQRDGAPFASDEVEIAVEVEVDPRHAPARCRRSRAPATKSGRASTNGSRRRAVDGVQLLARVGHEEVRAPVAVIVGACDPHPRVRVGHSEHAAARSLRAKPKAEP